MTIRDKLIAAKAIISKPENWGKQDDLGNGRLCAMLACSTVAAGPTDDFDAMRSALLAALPEGASKSIPQVVNFNDHPDTTHADVMAMFDRAIAAN